MSTIGRTFIRALLEDGSKSLLREVRVEWLTDEERPVYDFVRRHVQYTGRLPTPETVHENGFALGRAREPVAYYMRRLQERAVFNAITERHAELVQAMEQRNMDRAIAVVRDLNAAVKVEGTGGVIRMIGREALDILEDFNDPTGQTRFIPFGYGPLDAVTDGLQPGDVDVFAGRPNVGKSFFLLRALMKGWQSITSPMVITMEMQVRQLATRMVGMETGIDTRFIRRRELSTWGRNRIAETVQDFQLLPPLMFISGSMIRSVEDIELLVEDMQPDSLYIDAAYLVQSDKYAGRRSRWENISIVIGRLKQLADKAGIPIVITVQLNRGQKSKSSELKEGLEALAGADSIGQDASVVVGITPGAGVYGETRRRHHLLKNREGPKNFHWDTNFLFKPQMNFDIVVDEAEVQRTQMLRNMI